jgi:fibronectin-binding autotransporter adhesin
MNNPPLKSSARRRACQFPRRHRAHVLSASILAACAIFSISTAHAVILDQYTFGPNGSTPGVLSPSTVDPNALASDIFADPGLALDLTSPATQPPSTPYLRTTFNIASTTADAAFANNADFQFTLTAKDGFLLNLASLNFDVMRGGGSTPRGYAVRSSVDNYGTVLSTADVPTARPTFTNINVDLASPAYQNLTTITFKIYSYSPGTGASVDYDNITINGETTLLPTGGYIWAGTTNGNWNTTSINWTGPGTTYVDGTPASDVTFGDTGTNTNINVTPSPVAPDTITFTNETVPYTFSGSPINVTTTVVKSGAGTVTLNNSFTSPSAQIGGGTFAVGATGSLTIGVLNIGTSGSLTVAAGGTVAATTSLTNSGIVTFDNPTQALAALNGTNTGVVTLNGTALTITGSSNYDGRITGTGSLIKSGNGVLRLTNFLNDYAGATTVNGGTLQLQAVGSAGPGTATITVNTGGSLALGANINNPVNLVGGTIGVVAAVTLPSTLTISQDSTVVTFNPSSGAGPADLILTAALEGSGNIDFRSANGNNPDTQAFRLRGPVSTYSGTITLGPSAKFEIQTGVTSGSQMGTGKIRMTGGGTTTTGAGTYSMINVRNNSGADTTIGNNVEILGIGAAFFNLLGGSPAGSTSRFGDLLIGDGQSIVAGATASAAFTVAFATVHLTGGTATFTPKPVGNTNFLSVENISLGTISENVPGSGITMNGEATLTLTGTNTYTGPTTILSGITLLAAPGALPPVTRLQVDGGVVDLNANGTSVDQTVAALSGFGGSITNSDLINPRTLTVNQSTDTSFAGTFTGTLGLTKSGAGVLQLLGAHTHTGITTITSGTLDLGSELLHGSIAGNVIVQTGAKLAGYGTVGQLAAQAGGAISPGAAILPGSLSGILTTANFDLQSGATLAIDLAKVAPGLQPIPGTDFDQVSATDSSTGVTPTITLAGILSVLAGSNIETGDIFAILINNSSDPISGTFAALPNGSTFAAGTQQFQVSYFDNAATPVFELAGGNDVSLIAIPEPAAAFSLFASLGALAGFRRRRAA